MKKNIPDDLTECIDFHGHLCPGLAVGYIAARIGMKKMMWRRAKDEELVCIVMSDGCAVDAIQFMTGCTLGKGNLIFQDYGKMVFIFLRRKKGSLIKGIRLSFQVPSRWKRLMKSKQVTKEKVAHYLLELPEDKFFKIRRLKDYPLPERARIFPSHKCALCGEPTMEPRLKVSEGKLVCPECAPEAYTRGW